MMKKGNILLIMSEFYGYERLITQKLKANGYDVYLLNYLSPFWKLKINLLWGERKALKIHEWWLMNKLRRLEIEKFDTLLLIRGTTVQPFHMKYIIKRNPKIRRIMYQWDSVSLFDYLPLSSYFNKVFTFDMVDAEHYSFSYLPLFCAFSGKDVTDKWEEDIDLLLIGTYRPERYEVAVRYDKLCRIHGFSFKCLIYVPLSIYFRELLKRHVLSLKLCRFTPVPRKQVIDYYKRSKVFLDVISSLQQGYSMRTIECYGFNKKLITSNPYVRANAELKDMDIAPINMSEDEFVSFFQKPVHVYENKWKFSLDNFLESLLEAN